MGNESKSSLSSPGPVNATSAPASTPFTEESIPSTEVAAIGSTCIDHLSVVTRTADGWESCTAPLVQGGGLMATASVTVARLGGIVDLWAVIGDDYHGKMVKNELAGYGVGVDHVVAVPGSRTPCSYVEVDSETGERFIYYSPGRSHVHKPITEDVLEFCPSRIEGIKSLLVDGSWVRTNTAAARWAHERGIPVVADLFIVDGPNAEMVSYIDGLIVPEETGVELAGGRDFPRALEMLVDLGPRMPAITAGAEGCWYVSDGRIYHCPAFKVKAVDTTGCGDSFHGAFAFCMARGMDVHEAIRFSSAVAALKATKPGGRTGLPTSEQVLCFLEEHHEDGRAHEARD